VEETVDFLKIEIFLEESFFRVPKVASKLRRRFLSPD
jgi:hypothetical protein